jgi:hypothetical protein
MAIKTYENRRDDFEFEVDALNAIRRQSETNNRQFVQYFGHFTQGREVKGKYEKTSNLLLEYGEQDLEEYFAEAPPPATHDDIISFWRNLFRIADALRIFHQYALTPDTVVHG